MSKFKIFFGTHSGLDTNSADHKLNKWLEKNPDVYIVRWQYQQARLGDHSICVEYDKMKGETKQDDQ